jgi:hypothetical protein
MERCTESEEMLRVVGKWSKFEEMEMKKQRWERLVVGRVKDDPIDSASMRQIGPLVPFPSKLLQLWTGTDGFKVDKV